MREIPELRRGEVLVDMEPIAVIGMAVRFPASNNLDEFWDNLLGGRDCIGALSEEQILRAGEDPGRLAMPGYVRRRPRIDAPYDFDAAFFGVTPREAEIRDPQFRVFLEVSHAALEHAGQVPADFPGRVGVFAGAGANRYAAEHVEPDANLLRAVGKLAVDFNNDPDYFATSVAHRLGLTGPSLTVRTACSTSLVALHLARQALLAGDCEVALVGGAMIDPHSERGFVHVPGGVNSEDGSCRPFDSAATGTNFGDGVGVVVLKRLADALADGDTVYAVVRGSMVNNDGGRGTGFTAPSAEGQADCITGAFTAAGLDPGTISYFEAHGTGTRIGDRVEVAAMTKAFRDLAATPPRPGSCLLGSVKSNLGHLGAAAGVAGVIKTVLALWHEHLPASINVRQVNPELGLADSPFEVITSGRPWPRVPGEPRRACVNSFGIGGTNAHVILEEAPRWESAEHGGEQIFVWSADDTTAAKELQGRLRNYFADLDDERLADAAFTLQVGRSHRALRYAVVAADRAQLVERLSADLLPAERRTVVFHFPDESGWQPALARGLYDTVPDFRDACDSAFDVLGLSRRLDDSARPTLLAVQYALATCLQRWGVRPARCTGEGVGALAARAVMDGEISRALADETPDDPQWTHEPDELVVPLGPDTMSRLNETLATLWVHGQDIDWHRLAPRSVRRIAVPGYPYQRRRHWVAYQGSSASEQTGWTLLHEQWRLAEAAPALDVRGGSALVLRPDDAHWISDAVAQAGYQEGLSPDLVVHALGVAADTDVDTELENGLYGVLDRVQTLTKQRRSSTLVILSRHSVDLTGAEPLNPARAMLSAFARTIEREIPEIRCVLIDVGPTTVTSVLAAELASLTAPRVALRGRSRWLPEIVPVDPRPAGALRQRGTYLITGGLGGVGLEIAEALASTGQQPTLVLLGRSTGRAVPELPGATVRAISADVSDPEAMRRVVAEIEREHGGLHGVVHAAGVAGGGLVERRDRSEVDRVLRPKVHGTLALEAALRGKDLDFFVHFSSQAGVSGLRGSADYAAANAFLNAHAQRVRLEHPRALAIAWPAWERTGMTDVPGHRVVISPGETWQLDEHQFGSAPVLPATAMLEFVVRAARELALVPDAVPIGLRDTVILRALPATEPHVVEVTATAASGGHRFRLRSKPVRGHHDWTDHAEGIIEEGKAEPEPRIADSLPSGNHEDRSVASGPGFGFGPRWDCEVGRRRDEDSAIVELALPQRFLGDLREHPLHPALLDVATSALVDTTADAVFVPFRYRSVIVFDRLTERVTARSRLCERTASARVVDVDIHDTATGRHLVSIRSLTFRAVPRTSFGQAAPAVPREPQLRPEEGARIFLDAVRSELPPVVIVDYLGEPPVVDEPVAEVVPEPVADQPVTEVLRLMWTDLLGNPDIGLDDDFFDVGGSSLAAVHIVDQIEQRYGIALSSGALFESATVRGLAAMLTERGAR